MWAREFVTVEGLSAGGGQLQILIPAAAIALFFTILYLGLRKTQPEGPYSTGPDFVPFGPPVMPQLPPRPRQEFITEEQIVVVPKKKKYYHRKKK